MMTVVHVNSGATGFEPQHGFRDYSSSFFSRLSDGARRSADTIVPMLQALVRPRSVVDVGCGTGAWLASFQQSGVTDIVGVDGEWLDPDLLTVPRETFVSLDLRSGFELGRRFDLVLSLEVAEHLPPASAAVFVQSLVALGPVVVFSAAIPGQGGTSHVNEQWPEYWAALFARHGYTAIDCIRPVIWNNDQIEWWYAQNILIFAHETSIASNAALREAAGATTLKRLSLVHPRGFVDAMARSNAVYYRPDPNRFCLSVLLSILPRVAINAFLNRLPGVSRASS